MAWPRIISRLTSSDSWINESASGEQPRKSLRTCHRSAGGLARDDQWREFRIAQSAGHSESSLDWIRTAAHHTVARADLETRAGCYSAEATSGTARTIVPSTVPSTRACGRTIEARSSHHSSHKYCIVLRRARPAIVEPDRG